MSLETCTTQVSWKLIFTLKYLLTSKTKCCRINWVVWGRKTSLKKHLTSYFIDDIIVDVVVERRKYFFQNNLNFFLTKWFTDDIMVNVAVKQSDGIDLWKLNKRIQPRCARVSGSIESGQFIFL